MSDILQTSTQLIRDLKLEAHPEGGYFIETDKRKEHVYSPFAEGNANRSLATSIYYLLTYDNPKGYIHMNKSVTYHVLHQGRAEYTLITPGNPPKVEKKIMGTNTAAGETRQLLVDTGIWKMSQLLQEDFTKAQTDAERDSINCLITEVVVPGFEWEDHKYLSKEALEDLFRGVDNGSESIDRFSAFIVTPSPAPSTSDKRRISDERLLT
ncbi:RmlC-like cupin domain-containing protein [Cyathus striatus]|nr:RmlC-like cupin domain-containing protein [Cyathus striatus]